MTEKMNTEKFVSRAVAKHGERYDYSKVRYLGMQKKVVIGCKLHGEFEQTAANHLAGKGCLVCGRAITKDSRKVDPDNFIARANEIHRGKIDFSRSEYSGWNNRVLCVCPDHGEFHGLPPVILRGGNGCPKCYSEQKGPARLTNAGFSERATVVHGEKYDYSRVVYSTFAKDVEIICKEHGSFFQTALNHLQGKGCPRCVGSQSKPEIEIIEYIKGNYSGLVFERTRKVIPSLEIDVFAPDANFAIEFNGLYWHSADKVSDRMFRTKHKEKVNRCSDNGVRLLQIREDKYAARPDVYRSMIANALGFSTTVLYARKCEVRELSSAESSSFMDEHHLDGSAISSTRMGLISDGEVVSVMTFGVPRYSTKHDFELVRFASKKFHRVVGAAGRLLTAFRRLNTGSIVSYCNLEHGCGGVYRALGMMEIGESAPNYIWVKNGQKAYTRYQTQKHKLPALLKNFQPGLSEVENMFSNGFRRYWDSGNIVFEI